MRNDLKELDDRIRDLTIQRNALAGKLEYMSLVESMLGLGLSCKEKLQKRRSGQGVHFMNSTVVGWKNLLSPAFFPRTIAALPEYGCENGNVESILASVAAALDTDLAALV
jgi:hypothetical protein